MTDINYKEVAVAAVAGFVTSGVSAIYSDAAIAGTEIVVSKAVASGIVSGTASVLNQANDAADKGEPINISPVKMIKDIATDHLADNLSEKIPEIKIHGQEASNVNNVTKTTVSDASSKAMDMGSEFAKKPNTPTKLAPIQLGAPAVVNQADATANKIIIPKLKDQ